MISRVSELAFCLPPTFRDYANDIARHRQDFIPYFVPATPLNLSAYLQRRSDSNDNYCDDRQIDTCCCGWAFDSTPLEFPSLFGHSARSFTHYVHSGPQKLRLEGEDVAFDTRQAMNAVFGGPWSDNSSLRKSMIVFASILSVLFGKLFEMVDYVTQDLMDPEMTGTKDRLDRMAKRCRPQFFAHLLRSVLVMYHEFWNLDRESETDAENSGELWHQVYLWALKRPDSGRVDFEFGLLDILYRGKSAEMTEPDDPDLSSDEASTQETSIFPKLTDLLTST